MAKNQFQMHILWFFFHIDVNIENVHETFINTEIPF